MKFEILKDFNSSYDNWSLKFNDECILEKVTKKKIIEIGDWNMDTTSGITVAHGVSDFKKIRQVNVLIINDTEAGLHPLDRDNGSGVNDGSITLVASTDITLARVAGGFFDGITFDSTSFNRGFITIEFEA